MNRQNIWRWKLAALGLVAAAGLWIGGGGAAQYGSTFYYHNPRTGNSYSISSYGGRNSYHSGFGYSNRYNSYGASSGYGPRRVWSGQYYSSPRRTYGSSYYYRY